jgi:hypothetical protein
MALEINTAGTPEAPAKQSEKTKVKKVGTIKLPPPPTGVPDDSPFQEKPKKTGHEVGQIIGNGIVSAIIAFEGIPAMATLATSGEAITLPSIGHSIAHPYDFIQNISKMLTKDHQNWANKEALSPNFDNNTDIQTFKLGVNAKVISDEEAKNLAKANKIILEKGKYPVMLTYPWVNNIGDKNIKIKILYETAGIDSMTGQAIETTNNPIPCGMEQTYDRDQQVCIPLNLENAEIFKLQYKDPFTDRLKYKYALIRQHLPNGNGPDDIIEIQIRIENPSDYTVSDVIEQAPAFPADYNYLSGWNLYPDLHGKPIDPGTPILNINRDGVKAMFLWGTPASKITLSPRNANGAIDIRPALITTEDNGNNKVAIPESSK